MIKAGMMFYDTLRVLRQDTEDSLRTAEINNIMLPLGIALNEAEMIADDQAKKYLAMIIRELKPRILALIADTSHAGNSEQFRQ